MNWSKEINFAVTVTDIQGNIVEMNDKAAVTFEKYGGKNLIGQSLFDCHNANSGTKIREISQHKSTNVYTIEKSGVKKLIYQTPWYLEGEYAGLVELSIVIPESMPHFIR